MGPLGELGALFNPGMRHEIEERKSKANRREEEGNARDGDLRIDLASGVAVINMSKGGDQAISRAADGAAQQQLSPVGTDEPVVAQAGESAAGNSSVSFGREAPVDGADRPDRAAPGSTGPDELPSGEDRAQSSGPADDHSDAAADGAPTTTVVDGRALTAAQARRLATAARRSAGGDRPPRPAAPRPTNVQLPSSKASRAAR